MGKDVEGGSVHPLPSLLQLPVQYQGVGVVGWLVGFGVDVTAACV